jgi:LysR family transcriptional regulator, glycine cleavage system transcriptional activator
MTHSSRLPPLEHLPCIEAVARLGSFTAAADELGITHSAVSRRVHTVESWLGTTLFERHARGVTLTPAGQRFLLTVTEALALVGRFAEQWRPGRRVSTVKVSLVPSMARLWLLPRMHALQGTPQDLRFEIVTEHRLTRFEQDDTDIAVRYGPGEWSGFRSWPLFSETLVPVASAQLAEALGSTADAVAISRQPLIHDSDTRLWRVWFAQTGTKFRTKPDDRRFEDYDMVLIAAAAGLGVALLRSPLADDFARAAHLSPISKRSVPNPSSHHILIAEDEKRDHVIEAVHRLRAAALRKRQDNVET